ncbi:MAG: hypothetical protein K9L30_04780 [Desulfobacterales bacterium]|nr:hypothetical protein [Desulfobacterales bacterium]
MAHWQPEAIKFFNKNESLSAAVLAGIGRKGIAFSGRENFCLLIFFGVGFTRRGRGLTSSLSDSGGAIGAPHFPQNFIPSGFTGEPHLPQNFGVRFIKVSSLTTWLFKKKYAEQHSNIV